MAKVPVKNLKGTIPNFPKVPDMNIPQYDSSVVGNSPSFDDMFSNLLSSTPSSNKIENIPLSSFYIGNRYPESRPNTNVEEMTALQQSGLDKLGNGILKMTGKAGTSFVSGTAGLIYGIGKSITNGKFSDLYNNEITQTMDNVDKYLHDALPNYYTEAENSAEWWHKNNLLTANFVGDKILNNLGFSIGSLAGGVAWSSVFKGIGLTNNLVKAGKGLEALEATEKAMLAVPKAQKHIAFMNALQKTAQTYVKTPISSVLKSSDRIITSAMGTFGEASLEALQNTNEFRNKLIDNFREKNGRYPQEAELAEINEYADKVGNFTWGFNTLLLTGTNYVMLPKILGSSRKADKALSNITKVSPTGKFQAIKPSYISKGISGISKVFVPQEAFEEGAQFATQIGVNQYFERAYNNKQDIDSFYNNLSGAFKGVINEGIQETLNSKEGIESMLIGALSGGLQQGVGSLVSRIKNGRQPSEQQRTEAAVEILNSSNLKKYLQDFANYTARGLNSQNLRQQAIEQDDIVGEKDYEMDYTLSYVIPRVKYGKLDSVTQEVDYYLQQSLTQEGFQELKNEGIINSNETREQFVERVEKLKNVAKKVDSLYTQINDRYSPFVNEKGEKVYSEQVIDKMVYAASKIEDYNNRIVDLSTPLVEAGLTPDIILNDLNKGEFTSLEQAEQEINNSQTLNPEQQDDVKSQLVDLIEISQRRTKLINEYNELRSRPNSVKYTESQPKGTISISQEEGNIDVELGKSYEIADPYLRVGNKIIPTPNITPLSSLTGKEIEVKLPTGEISFIKPSEFKKYKITSLSKDDRKELKEVFDSSLDKVLSKAKYENLPEKTIEYVNSLNNEELINEIEEEVKNQLSDFSVRKEAEEKLLKNKELQRGILGTKDTGIENSPNDPNYEPVAKKDSNTIVNSTKVPSDSILPHHIRSNFFGINFSLFSNRDKIRGVIVTSKNEAQLGLSGLMDYLKGDSEVDPSKTIALVFVEESENGTITLLNKEGKPLTVPSIQEAVYQVFPDPELTWSQKWGGGSMFRKGTTPEEINYYKEEYKKWVNETLNNPSLTTYNVVPSMGKPVIEEENGQKQYNTRNSVIDTNLVKAENLQNNPLIYVPTLSKAEEKNGVQFTLIPGRPYLNLPNGFVPLNNRQFSEKEASTLYKVILELSKDIAKNEDAKSPKAKKLISWLKSVIYWGTPKNNAGYNSIFFDTKDDKFNLYISGKNFSIPFTPQSIENSKDKLITILEGMYNNVQGGLTDKAEIWNAPYEQITDITPEGEIITRNWDNYQTYLLTSPNLPLSTNIAKYTENKPNRQGIYFTVPNLSEKYFYISPKKEEIVITKETPKTEIKEEKSFVISDLTLNFVPNSDLVKTKGARKNKAEQKRIKDELEQLNNILKCLSAI